VCSASLDSPSRRLRHSRGFSRWWRWQQHDRESRYRKTGEMRIIDVTLQGFRQESLTPHRSVHRCAVPPARSGRTR